MYKGGGAAVPGRHLSLLEPVMRKTFLAVLAANLASALILLAVVDTVGSVHRTNALVAQN